MGSSSSGESEIRSGHRRAVDGEAAISWRNPAVIDIQRTERANEQRHPADGDSQQVDGESERVC